MPLFRAIPLTLLSLSSLVAQEPTLARQLLKEMVDTDTTGEHGDTTPLVESLAKRFRAAGVPTADVAVVGPEARHRNLVVRLRGTSPQKPLLVISHLDVPSGQQGFTSRLAGCCNLSARRTWSSSPTSCSDSRRC